MTNEKITDALWQTLHPILANLARMVISSADRRAAIIIARAEQRAAETEGKQRRTRPKLAAGRERTSESF